MKFFLLTWLAVGTFTGSLFGGDAAAETSIIETMGVSIAVGAVLGASTLPFYDQPGQHASNIAYGASLGAAVGIGLLIYGYTNKDSESGDGYGLARFGGLKQKNALGRRTLVTPHLQLNQTSRGNWDPAVCLSLVSLN